MVEGNIGQCFPNVLKFINERDALIMVLIHYEWKPTTCNNCKRMGHETGRCTRAVQWQEWRVKKSVVQEVGQKPLETQNQDF